MSVRGRGNLNDDGERLQTAREVASYLGYHVKTIYRWVREGDFPVIRNGRTLRFRLSDILRWFSARKEG